MSCESDYYHVSSLQDSSYALHFVKNGEDDENGRVVQIKNCDPEPWKEEIGFKLESLCPNRSCFSIFACFILNLHNIRSPRGLHKLGRGDEIYFLVDKKLITLNRGETVMSLEMKLIEDEKDFFVLMEIVSEIFNLPIIEMTHMRCQF